MARRNETKAEAKAHSNKQALTAQAIHALAAQAVKYTRARDAFEESKASHFLPPVSLSIHLRDAFNDLIAIALVVGDLERK